MLKALKKIKESDKLFFTCIHCGMRIERRKGEWVHMSENAFFKWESACWPWNGREAEAAPAGCMALIEEVPL